MKCLATGKPVRHGNIFASVEAETRYRDEGERLASELKDKGFTRIESTPNLFIKDGRAITLEAYRNDPAATLVRHTQLG